MCKFAMSDFEFFHFLFYSVFFETLRKIFSLFFFKNVVFLINYSTDFRKNSTSGKSSYSPVFLHTSLIYFYLTPLSTAFEKVCGIILTHVFGFFKTFSRKLPSQV